MKLTFTPLADEYAITKLAHDAPLPDWIGTWGLTSITRASGELSIVCPAQNLPDDVAVERGWAALRVDMLAALDEPGVVMAAIAPISKAGLGVFVISTHLRDYILVPKNEMKRVRQALSQTGHDLHH